MASVSEFRTGMAIRHNNDIWIVTEFQHVTPGNWRAMLRTKLKNVKTGRVMEVTFRMTDKIEEVRLIETKMQYLYADDALQFLDTETYDQTYISPEMLGGSREFLKEGDMVSIYFMENQPLLAEMPNFVELEIAEAEPAVRGDSATNIMKYAVVQTGAKVQVPLFIKVGDVIKIDTRTGRYIERVSTG
jgi:elongation factor P